MTPEDIKLKVDELRTLIVEKLVELEVTRSGEQRRSARGALSDHAAVMRDVLREEE